MKIKYSKENNSILALMLAHSRDILYNYDEISNSGMFNDPKYVILEMTKEILKLRKKINKDGRHNNND